MKILRTASLGSNFAGSYKKRVCSSMLFITRMYNSEVYLGPCQPLMVKRFCKNDQWLKAFNYFYHNNPP